MNFIPRSGGLGPETNPYTDEIKRYDIGLAKSIRSFNPPSDPNPYSAINARIGYAQFLHQFTNGGHDQYTIPINNKQSKLKLCQPKTTNF